MQNVFLFHPKSSFRSGDIQFFVIFLFPHFLDSKGEMEVEFMMSWTDLQKCADVIFGITKKLLYITSSNLVR